MTFNDVQFIFNRALSKSFELKKNLFVFVVLALCGVLVVFFRGLAVNAGEWLLMSLFFLPVFLCTGVLLSAGILLIRIYHDEIKKKEILYGEVIAKSWEVLIGASYFAIPIILSYLLLWMLLGVFFLFRSIPGFGDFFAVILAFGPFLINLSSLILCCLSLCLLFYVSPVIALKGINRLQVAQSLERRFKHDAFSNILLGLVALIPLIFVISLLVGAALLTDVCYNCDQPMYTVLQWFFIMIPFAALMAPPVVFFFNFAAESHVLILKESRA